MSHQPPWPLQTWKEHSKAQYRDNWCPAVKWPTIGACLPWSRPPPNVQLLFLFALYIADWTESLTHAGQVAYCWTTPHTLVIKRNSLKQGLLKLSRLASDFSPPALVSGAGWIYSTVHHTQFRHLFLSLTGLLDYSSTFFCRLTWSLPLDYQTVTC